MKKIVIVLVFIILFSAVGCTAGDNAVGFTEYGYFGAVLTVKGYCEKSVMAEIKDETKEFLAEFSLKVDEGISGSDLYNFNNAIDGQTIEVSEVTYKLLSKAKDAYSLTNGDYNPCVYHLVDLWGFSKRFFTNYKKTKVYDRDFVDNYYPLPDNKYVDAFKLLTDFDKVEFSENNGKYTLTKNNTKVSIDGVDYYLKLDIGGIIKGYVTDVVKAIMVTKNVTKGYVSYGTSSLCLLDNADNTGWELTLTHPRKEGTYCDMRMSNKFVATSGDYERFYNVDGKRYSHLIDGKTGKPIDNGVCSVTVFCDDGLIADALSTALSVGGKEKIKSFVNGSYAIDNGIKVVAVFEENGELKVFSTQEITLKKGIEYEKN